MVSESIHGSRNGSTNPYPNIFSPLKIKNTVFRNRIFAAPITTERTVVDGCPTQECINSYETKARGGFAEVTCTESFVDFERASRHEHGLDLVRPNMTVHHMESLYILSQAIKAHGAVASIQFNHAGNLNHPSTIKDGKNPIGPSGFVRPDGVVVEEMDEPMMHHVADNFANACGAAKDFGFDMAMLHGGHGWLLAQFVSPLTNRRTDAYGGSIENRARFPLMVLDAIRQQVGDDFLIEYRMSGAERVPGGLELEESTRFAQLIEDRVDLIHVTSGIYHSHVQTKAFSSMFDDHGCNLDLAAAIKQAVHVPVVSVGGFNHPSQIEGALASHQCDAVALGRQQFADPDFVIKVQQGRTDEIAPCLRCSCFNPLAVDPGKRPVMRPFECTVNPRSCRELRLESSPKPTARRKVLVIGGGPGGMYAAITAAERGHSVTLIEREQSLGGILRFTDRSPIKDDLRRYRDSLITRVHRSGVNVRCGETAETSTVETLQNERPEAVICAIGAAPRVPDIPGVESAAHVMSIYEPGTEVGHRVVIIGGGQVGCESAYELSRAGHDVTLIEIAADVARDAYPSHRDALLPRLRQNVTVKTRTTCTRILPNAVQIRSTSGAESLLDTDTVLYSIGMKPCADTVDQLRQAFPVFRAIGDCVQPRTVLQAVREGMYAAMDVL